jgi:hypothetical protein
MRLHTLTKELDSMRPMFPDAFNISTVDCVTIVDKQGEPKHKELRVTGTIVFRKVVEEDK